MPIEQFLGRSAERAAMADDSGRWGAWVRAQPALSRVGSAVALVDVLHDRAQPQAANELLLALVRVGSADGGGDEAAATFVATLLAPGANRIIRSLSSLGPEVADIVAGQLWLQVRDYPWRDKPRAVAKNILMDTRRAVLRDYGASTHRRAALVPIPSPDDVDPRDHALERVTFEAQVPDLALLQLLVWATAWRILRRGDARLLWDLVLVDALVAADPDQTLRPGGNTGSWEGTKRFAAALGVTERQLRRRRDHAVSALRVASDQFRGDFDIGLAVGAATPTPTPGPRHPSPRPASRRLQAVSPATRPDTETSQRTTTEGSQR
jgi:hypothetical protein